MVSVHSRRSLLKLGVAVGIGGFAGCTSMFEKPPELRIRNLTSEKRSITVQLTSAITGNTYIDDEFRIPPGGPHITAKEVFPSTGDYDICAATDGISEQCETWIVEQDNPEYHITLNPSSEEADLHFTMGRFDQE
ncbi:MULTISPECIES: hypothetical protein [unclassified Haladaptatus]|uniref:hypothetical protein n=1 Tax=unclassified Haladaptatus TaxID=2622732 RepID=UPI0023E7DC04|nr:MULTISPECIES: hypothetical protein [unclassified Haladaptatus]